MGTTKPIIVPYDFTLNAKYIKLFLKQQPATANLNLKQLGKNTNRDPCSANSKPIRSRNWKIASDRIPRDGMDSMIDWPIIIVNHE